jgi:hypothetical protein
MDICIFLSINPKHFLYDPDSFGLAITIKEELNDDLKPSL